MSESNQDKSVETALLRQGIIEMSQQAQAMFRASFDGLMKHDINILNQVLKGEGEITKDYDRLTSSAIEAIKKKLPDEDKKAVICMVDILCAIERIGDFCVGLAERTEYKIRENLLFSEEAVKEYKGLFDRIDKVLTGLIEAMKANDKKLAKDVLKDKTSIYALIEKSRANHIDRSARGICDEWAKIRYLDMLDFVKDIVDRCAEISGLCPDMI